jgi:hypothetical protein
MQEEDFWWRKGSSEKYGSNSPTLRESVFMWTRGIIWNKNDFIRSFIPRATRIALALAQQWRIDLRMTDSVTPGTSGSELGNR